MTQPALFDPGPGLPPPPPPDKVSPDVRRRQRQAACILSGLHPLTAAGYTWPPIRLHPDAPRSLDRTQPGPRCGTCWYRHPIGGHSRDYPKCWYGYQNPTDTAREFAPRITGGPGTDIAAWWPACPEHSYGDPSVSDDAARYIPERTDT